MKWLAVCLSQSFATTLSNTVQVKALVEGTMSKGVSARAAYMLYHAMACHAVTSDSTDSKLCVKHQHVWLQLNVCIVAVDT